MICRYCAETIKDTAIKCRFCGSDLTENKSMSQNASDRARAFIKASKEKEVQDLEVTALAILALAFSSMIGYIFHQFWIGALIFFALLIIISKKWIKE